MDIKNKIAVVTGGSAGLGLSVVNELLTRGSVVHVIGRDKTRLDELKKLNNNPNLNLHTGDVSDPDSLHVIAGKIKDCDVLVNNAGVWLEGDITENSFEEISKVIDINLKGLIYTTKVFLPFMLKKNDGFVINVSSTTGLKGRENQAAYAASKFGVTGFTESLKEDLKSTNIKVAGFYPGGMNTKLFEKGGFPKENTDWMDTHKVAKVITFILELDDTMLLDHVILNKRGTKTTN